MKLFIILFSATMLFAAPSFQSVRTYMQSDGSTFQAKAQGDEYLHFLTTSNGDILLFNPRTKNFEYAEVKNERLVPSGIAYKAENNKRTRRSSRLGVPTITPEQIQKLYKKARERFYRRD